MEFHALGHPRVEYEARINFFGNEKWVPTHRKKSNFYPDLTTYTVLVGFGVAGNANGTIGI